jgi:hypothetical protein
MRRFILPLVGSALVLIAPVVWSGQVWAQAPTVEELKRELDRKDRQIRELMERVERLERTVGTRPAAPPAAVAPVAAPTPAEEPGKLKVSIGGYVKLDLQHADRDLGGSNLNFSPKDTPLGPTRGEAGQQGRFSVDARETRFNIEAAGPINGVGLRGRVEVDFYGNEDNALTNTGRVIRLREAFARADVPLEKDRGWYLLAGQTTSAFSNSEIAAADTVDANGPAGILGARQPQLRLGYKLPVGPADSSVVFESAVQQHSFSNFTTGDSGTTPRSATDGQGQDLPLFVGKLQWLNSLFQLESAGAISRNRGVFDRAGDRGPVATRSETAWGVQVSGQAAPWEPVTFYAHYQHLDGLNREGNGDFADAVSEAGGGVFRLRNIETDGWYTGLAFKPWVDTTFNFVYGQNEADEDVAGGFTRGTTIRRQRSIHVNVMQKFWSQWKLGLEYQRFMVDTFGPSQRDGSVNFYHGGLWFFY